ncbi:hypothetical protein C8R44DRAFT_360612 [Mycena epipterygia]|nr:hypothetical protein C8R44DRAFT_360612 [Mycena epipterygia]
MHSVSNLVCFGFLATIGYALAAGPAPVVLGTAGNFAILAKTGVSTVPNSAITGNVGISPATDTALTGFSLVEDSSGRFSTSAQVNGRLMGATDSVPTPGLLTVAVSDMQTAFTDAMSRPIPDFVEFNAGVLGGSILVPGLYKWTTGVSVSTGITLAGGPSDTWIFQITGTLAQASDVQMTLAGGALSQNIIWAVSDTVTVAANAVFEGNILAQNNVVLATDATSNGCIYAQTAVTLQKATVSCSGGGPPPDSQCPPTAVPCSTVTFSNLNASIQADDYLTYTLTDNLDDCINFCACQASCGFVNFYFDNDAITKNSTMLTCALYAECHTAAEATNPGEQTGPDGNLGTITASSGHCLGAC